MPTPRRIDGLLCYPHERIVVACDVCTRRGDYSRASLQKQFGDEAMSDLPLLIAAAGGCEQAVPMGSCRARIEPHEVIVSMRLAEAMHKGWQLKLACQRHREGMKSSRPCSRGAITLDMRSLVAALGHHIEIEQLPRGIVCPGCGSKAVSLFWVVPTEAKSA